MIIKLSGVIEEVITGILILNVNNVYYEINVSELYSNTLKSKINKNVIVNIYHSITENNQSLYGFKNLEERNFFKYLTSLKGLGAASVMKMFSVMNPSDIAQLFHEGDIKGICKLPSIGTKTAEKLLLEFKGTIKKFDLTGISKSDYNPEVLEKAIEGLTSLGFEKGRVTESVNYVYKTGMNVSELVNKAIIDIR